MNNEHVSSPWVEVSFLLTNIVKDPYILCLCLFAVFSKLMYNLKLFDDFVVRAAPFFTNAPLFCCW